MNLHFDKKLADGYKSKSQIIRVLSESWVKQNIYCINCGAEQLNEFDNNVPVADFYCRHCKEEFELKSKRGKSLGSKITDGAYDSMMSRIQDDNSPSFFFLNYDANTLSVLNFLSVPSYYFVKDIIEKRKPLPKTSRRAGWVGCNILINQIPKSGRTFYIKNGLPLPKSQVLKKWQKTLFLKQQGKESRGWVIDVMHCVDRLDSQTFGLKQMYHFEPELKLKYPENNHIKAKIRQQLQILRDRGVIEFLGCGKYRKLDV